MENLVIRLLIKNNGLKYQDVAKELFLNPSWFSQKLRKPLSEKESERVKAAILRLIEEKAAHD